MRVELQESISMVSVDWQPTQRVESTSVSLAPQPLQVSTLAMMMERRRRPAVRIYWKELRRSTVEQAWTRNW
jgi:hypothetical protein